MLPCDCTERHVPKRVVLTGGPGAGKTAILDLLRAELPECCKHHVVQELEQKAVSRISATAA